MTEKPSYADLEKKIKALERLNKMIKSSEAKHKFVLSNMSDVVFMSDDKGHFTYISPNVSTIFGYTTKEVYELYNVAHLLGVGLYPTERIEDTGKIRNLELSISDKFGTKHHLLVNVEQISQGNTKLIYTCHDVTALKKQEKIREISETIMRYNLKSSFIGILGSMDYFMNKPNFPKEQIELFAQIKKSAKASILTIDDCLDMERIEKGVYNLKRDPFDINQMLNRINDTYKSSFNHLNIRLKEPIGYNNLSKYYGDGHKLETMFSNLVANAFEANLNNAGVTISISTENNSYKFDIHNMGVVPDEIRDDLFNSCVACNKYGGMGIGTYYAALIAKVHGGNITYTSSKEEGTHVIVTLPKAAYKKKSY